MAVGQTNFLYEAEMAQSGLQVKSICESIYF
jgi:hypothetical protein